MKKHRSQSNNQHRPEIRIGTSGWSYKSWRRIFFPRELLLRHLLNYYATQFDTAELNGVFYRTPSLATVHNWVDATPDGFIFSWKASRFITHWKRLSDRSLSSIAIIEERLRILGPKAGPVLFQLPPQFRKDVQRLSSFVKLLPKRRRFTFEFRDKSWYHEDIFAILKKNNIALCLSDHEDAPAPWMVTADFVYVRGHGPGGNYKKSYADSILVQWTKQIERWQRQSLDIYIYFDNDQKGVAPFDARRLISMLNRK